MITFESKKILAGFLLAFLGTGMFAFKSIFIKLAYLEGLNADSVMMLRMLFSLPVYVLIIAVLYRTSEVPKSAIRSCFPMVIFLGIIGYCLGSWLDLKGLEYISAGMERLTLFTYPIFIAIFGALFFKTPLSNKIIITLITTYSGLLIIFSQELKVNGDQAFLGVFLVLLSALCYSFYVLFGKKVITAIGALWFTALSMTVSSVVVLTFSIPLVDIDLLNIRYEAWVWIALLVFISTVIPSFMISAAIARIGPAQTSIFGTLGPVITIVFASFLLREPFTMYHAIGIALVISGVMLLTVKPTKSNTHNNL